MRHLARIILLTAGVIFLFNGILRAETVTGARDLPDVYNADDNVEVSIDVDVDESHVPNGLIINEYIPSGWTLISASPLQNSFNTDTGKIKWLFTDSDVTDRAITYSVSVPAGESGVKSFTGELNYNDPANGLAPTTVVIAGDTQISQYTAVTVTNVSPDNGVNNVTTDITITGTGFSVGVSDVMVGITACVNVDRVSSTTITATVPAGIPVGTYDVAVTNPDDNSGSMASAFTVTAPPELTVTDSVAPADDLKVPFGVVTKGDSSDETITITNDGDAGLDIGDIAQTNPLESPFSIVTDNCSNQTLAPSSGCTLEIRFSPEDTGAFSDDFDIVSNDPDEETVIINVEGTASDNHPPATPNLIYPDPEQTGLETTLTFKWEKSSDSDGDTITYDLYYCDNSSFSDCNPVEEIASSENKGAYHDSAAGYGTGLLLLGIVFAGTGKDKKKQMVSNNSSSYNRYDCSFMWQRYPWSPRSTTTHFSCCS